MKQALFCACLLNKTSIFHFGFRFFVNKPYGNQDRNKEKRKKCKNPQAFVNGGVDRRSDKHAYDNTIADDDSFKLLVFFQQFIVV